MKKNLACILAVILCCCAACAAAETAFVIPRPSYEDGTGVSFVFPEGWLIERPDWEDRTFPFSQVLKPVNRDPLVSLIYHPVDLWPALTPYLGTMGFAREDIGPELMANGWLASILVPSRTRNEWDFREIVTALQQYWENYRVAVTPGFISILSDLLFVAADRRQINALKTICSLSRSVIRHDSVDRVMRQHFAMEWSNTAAQIAQRGWEAECQLLLKHLCLCSGSLRDDVLIKRVMADVSLHMQIQSRWDNFETAFRLFYPCQLFSLVLLHWGMNRYNHVLLSEKVMEVEAATRDSGILGQMEQKMELLEEKDKALGMIRFVLRNGRDMAAACARLLMKDEWEIYVAWQREWLSAVAGKEKRQKQVRQFMQMTAEYWQSTQPSRSNKQWKAMAEVVNPSQLSDKHLELIKLVS